MKINKSRKSLKTNLFKASVSRDLTGLNWSDTTIPLKLLCFCRWSNDNAIFSEFLGLNTDPESAESSRVLATKNIY